MTLLAAVVVGLEELFMTFDGDSSETKGFDSAKRTTRGTFRCSPEVFLCPFNPLETHRIIPVMSQQDAPSAPPLPPDLFDTKRLAIKWAIDTNVKHHKQARTKRSDSERVHLVCTDPQCAFLFLCAEERGGGVQSGAMVLAFV